MAHTLYADDASKYMEEVVLPPGWSCSMLTRLADWGNYVDEIAVARIVSPNTEVATTVHFLSSMPMDGVQGGACWRIVYGGPGGNSREYRIELVVAQSRMLAIMELSRRVDVMQVEKILMVERVPRMKVRFYGNTNFFVQGVIQSLPQFEGDDQRYPDFCVVLAGQIDDINTHVSGMTGEGNGNRK